MVALENLPGKADRLQPFSRQTNDLDESPDVKSWTIRVVELGGGRLRHPRRDGEALAGRRHQVVRRWRPAAALTDPERLTRKGVEWIVDSRVLGIRILLTALTTNYLFSLVLFPQNALVPLAGP